MFFVKVQGSYLFELEKEGKVIHLYGTYHSLSLQELPEQIQSSILNHRVLITESTDQSSPLNYTECKNMGILHEGECFFEMLTDKEKDELSKYVNPFLKRKNAEITIRDLNTKGLFEGYLAGHFIEGMDYALLDRFKDKTTKGLETRLTLSQYFEELTFEQLREQLKNKGGFESEQSKQIDAAYLSGNFLRPPQSFEQDYELEFEDMRKRNASWIEPIIHYHELYGRDAIICVGVAHIYDLLLKLSTRGFKIRRANNDGIFFPYLLE